MARGPEGQQLQQRNDAAAANHIKARTAQTSTHSFLGRQERSISEDNQESIKTLRGTLRETLPGPLPKIGRVKKSEDSSGPAKIPAGEPKIPAGKPNLQRSQRRPSLNPFFPRCWSPLLGCHRRASAGHWFRA